MQTVQRGLVSFLTPLVTPPDEQEHIERLTNINIDDLYRSFRLEDAHGWRWLLDAVFTPPALWFARSVAEYDRRVGRDGLAAGARWIMDRVGSSLTVKGCEHVPDSGPVLFLSNHPGVTDTMALAASIPRQDLFYIAYERPFLMELPNTSRHLIYVDEDDARQRMTVLRKAVRSLEKGRAIATFPGGRIDPDPAGASGAVDALQGWSESVALLIKRVPNLTVVPTLIHGVISPSARRSPITKLYADPADREWVAATLQMAVPVYRHADVTVTFGPALPAEGFPSNRAAIMGKLTAHMTDLIHDVRSTP